jgi:uncharacterized protein
VTKGPNTKPATVGREPPATVTINTREARRIALAAQGFGAPRRRKKVDLEAVRRATSDLGLLQLDAVNVFCRSHYMPIYSRLGPYDRTLLDRLAVHDANGSDRRFIEFAAHEAALIPIGSYPLFRWRMARVDQVAWAPLVKLAHDKPEVIASALAQVAAQGPIRASATGGTRTKEKTGALWNFQEGKAALEYLFSAGQVCASGRVNFERLYDLPERVLPEEVLNEPTLAEEDAQRQLVRIAAKALGVATEPDLGDYFRLSRSSSKARVQELVESGELVKATVEGWKVPAYLWSAAPAPKRVDARAILSPFDSLVWFRDRTEQLFGFNYRIEIYTPAAKRLYGYYVLPFLLDEALSARVDLKSDRQNRVLLVQGAFIEEGFEHGYVAAQLALELRQVADWLGLEDVTVRPNGNLAQDLRAAL